MNIESIGILGGTGGLGTRFAEYFAHQFPELKVAVSGRKTKLTNQDLVEQSDLVIFAVPIDQTLKVIDSMVKHAREDQIWVDFTSIKQQPVEAMLKSKAQVCGLHPLFGPMPEIEGQTLIYCPERIEPETLSSLLALLKAFNLMEFSPGEHDDLMGVVQCASHLSDLVMGQTLRDSGFDFETIWQVSSPSYRLKLEVMGRMFAQNPDLYADIATQNLSAPRFTDLFKAATDELNAVVNKRDRKLLIKNFDQTKSYLTPEFCASAYEASQHFLAAYTSTPVRTAESPDLGLEVDIAVFGEMGSHTDQALADFEIAGSKRYFSNIFRLIEALNKGTVKWGIVPYENTTEGSVLEVLDELLSHANIQIVDSTLRSIEQYLMVNPGTQLGQVKRVLSHPQALAQSKTFLRAQLPEAEITPAASTATAARRLKQAQNQSWAAVGSQALAEELGLQIISPNMARDDNFTRFVLLQKGGRAAASSVTSCAFYFAADQAGNLATVLNYFADERINLLKLDSRRAEASKGGFVFFVDAELSLPEFEAHLPALKQHVAGIQILGSY